MRIAIAADHAGFLLKEALRERLRESGYEPVDLGTDSAASTDYPDYAAAVGTLVTEGGAEYGVLVCSTGMGMSIAANKVAGVRAAFAANEEAVRLTRAHNDANVLAFGAKFTSEEEAFRLIHVFLNTPFDGGRHALRVQKIGRLEARNLQEKAST